MNEQDKRHALGVIWKGKDTDGVDVYEIVASNAAIDRDNEIIDIEAWERSLKPYLKKSYAESP